MGQPGKKLPAVALKKDLAAEVLALTGSRTAAAKAAKVHPQQISRWLADDDYRAKVQKLIEAGMEPARVEWNALVIRALKRVGELVDSKDLVIAERAARTVLDRHKEFAPHQHQHDASGLTKEQLIERMEKVLAKLKEPL